MRSISMNRAGAWLNSTMTKPRMTGAPDAGIFHLIEEAPDIFLRPGDDADIRCIQGGDFEIVPERIRQSRFGQEDGSHGAGRAFLHQFLPAATNFRASSSEKTPAIQAATISPMEWPSIASGLTPHDMNNFARAYSTTNNAGCVLAVWRRTAAPSPSDRPGSICMSAGSIIRELERMRGLDAPGPGSFSGTNAGLALPLPKNSKRRSAPSYR